MAWTIEADYISAFSERLMIDLAADTANPVAIDSDILDAAIALQTSRIKSKLEGFYPSDVTAETASDMIKEIELCLVVRSLFNRRDGVAMDLDLSKRIDAAEDDLKLIAKGHMTVFGWTEADSASFIELHHSPHDNETIEEWHTERTEHDF